MAGLVLIGAQWGDEGKGKITDYLAQQADVVVRYQGGDNAGHTITSAGQTYKLHLVPSGILFSDKVSVIGNGVVLNPKSLVGELHYLQQLGIKTDHLRISNRAHVIMPYHQKLDQLQEAAKGTHKIGTTGKGIGPAYMDKVSRVGIRVADLISETTFKEKLQQVLTEKNHLLVNLYHDEPLDFATIYEEYVTYGQELKKYVTDTSLLIDNALNTGKNVLFEGAQGVMLDIDHGTYPFVTSSNPIGGGAAVGAGVGPQDLQEIIGICKAYSTRVGAGPFPTEVFGDLADTIRERGHEYGTVTKRPRRIGWFDGVAMQHAKRVAGLTQLSLNLLDVLDGMESIKIGVGYQLDGKEIDYVPANLDELARVEPVYETLPGWSEDISQVQEFADLPINAQAFVKRLETLVGLPISMISVGPDRQQTIIRKTVWGD